MFHEQQQQDTHILAILGDQKHYFKVKSNALSYTRALRSYSTKDHKSIRMLSFWGHAPQQKSSFKTPHFKEF